MKQTLVSGAQILFGAEAIKSIYQDTLKADRLDIVCLSQNYAQVLGSFFDTEYAPQLFSSPISTREILPDNPGNRAEAANKDGVKHAVKFLKPQQASESDYLLFKSTAVLISFNKSAPFAVVISDQEMVANLSNQFEALWSRL